MRACMCRKPACASVISDLGKGTSLKAVGLPGFKVIDFTPESPQIDPCAGDES